MNSTRRLRAMIIGVGALVALVVPTAAHASAYTPTASGPLVPNTYQGSVAKTSTSWQLRANGPVGYARLVRQLSSPWTAGQRHSYGGRFRLDSATGYVNLLRADNYRLYQSRGYVFGVARYNGDRLGHLVVGTYSGNDQVIGPAFAIPVGQWFDLKVTITVGSQIAVSLNGTTVASGPFHTPSGMERISAVRAGVVATGNSGAIDVQQQSFTVDE